MFAVTLDGGGAGTNELVLTLVPTFCAAAVLANKLITIRPIAVFFQNIFGIFFVRNKLSIDRVSNDLIMSNFSRSFLQTNIEVYNYHDETTYFQLVVAPRGEKCSSRLAPSLN
jgi:hypothetical protein